jgi:peptidoglycan hydrolase-like protein with peptidoglycan-binding domain
MEGLRPDTTGLEAIHNQPEFTQKLWQYLNRVTTELAATLAESLEIHQRLTVLGFDTGGADGRIGDASVVAVQNFQHKAGISLADGYPGVRLLARLRKSL